MSMNHIAVAGYIGVMAAVNLTAVGAALRPPVLSEKKAPAVQSCNDGWKFLFVANDTGRSYAVTGAPDSSAYITIPHVFPSGDPTGKPASGFGWYFREIEIPDSLDGRELLLEFKGVCLYADVFVNGVPARGAAFAYLPFDVNLTPYTGDGKKLHIAVRVDNRLLPDRQGMQKAISVRF